MKQDKTNKLEINASRWPQNQISMMLIIAAMIIGCCYMVNSVIQVLDTIR